MEQYWLNCYSQTYQQIMPFKKAYICRSLIFQRWSTFSDQSLNYIAILRTYTYIPNQKQPTLQWLVVIRIRSCSFTSFNTVLNSKSLQKCHKRIFIKESVIYSTLITRSTVITVERNNQPCYLTAFKSTLACTFHLVFSGGSFSMAHCKTVRPRNESVQEEGRRKPLPKPTKRREPKQSCLGLWPQPNILFLLPFQSTSFSNQTHLWSQTRRQETCPQQQV